MKVTNVFGEEFLGTSIVEFIIDDEIMYRNYEEFCNVYGYQPISEYNMRQAINRVIEAERDIVEGEFVTVSICDLVDRLGYDYTKHSYKEECEMVDQWCSEWNVMLYERPREDFFKSEGVRLAQEGGFKGVVYSDLS